MLGIAFVTPSKVWMFQLIGGKERYLITGLGYAIGTEILGRQTTTICWIIWHYTQNVTAPAVYILVLSLCVILFPKKSYYHLYLRGHRHKYSFHITIGHEAKFCPSVI
ncbi:MAG UNVERIFIED_CONTAM: hypothetical protein LVQ98_00690 [Rickettsiaceae bacterium]